MRPPLDGVVLLTGASSGIGLELSKLLARRAKKLILVARRKALLERLRDELLRDHPNLDVLVEVADLTDRGSTDALIASVKEKVGHVDVLVNNAGAGDVAVFDLAQNKRCEDLIALNVTSLVTLTHAFVGSMVERRSGGILNVSSGFGLVALPGMAVYVGSKHFVTGFTEALRGDLAGTGVVVTQVCPGPVATEFEANTGNPTGIDVPELVQLSAARCARVALEGFERGRAMIVPGALMTIVMSLVALTPRWLLRALGSFLGRELRRRQLQKAA